jgi:hypothetical protein
MVKSINKLIAYHGGGYDGCIWEWNFCLYDRKGKFHDLYSTGVGGCKSSEEIIDYVKEGRGTWYQYSLSTNRGYQKFAEKYNHGIVVNMTKELNTEFRSLLEGTPFSYPCDECKYEVFADEDEGFQEGFQGAGGIAIQATLKLCNDCYLSGTCCNCGDYDNTPNALSDMEYCGECIEADGEAPWYECTIDDEDPYLIKGEKYIQFSDRDMPKELWVLDEQKDIQSFPVEYFNIPYEILNPNQLNLFIEKENIK